MKRIGLLTLFGLLACGLATGEVTMHVEAGIGDQVREGAYTPVRVIVRNDTENDYRGRVKVGFQPIISPSPFAWYYRTLDMPPGAEKLVYVYANLNAPSDEVTAIYETNGGREIASTTGRLRTFGRALPVMLTVGDAVFGLPSAKVEGNDQYYRVSSNPERLPLRPEGFNMFDATIMVPAPAEPLRARTSEALRAWVLQGGTLVIDASRRADSLQDPILSAMLPFTPTQQQQGTFDLFEVDVPYTTGQFVTGEIVLEADDVPLVMRRPYGLGSVVCFAADPNSPAIKGWEGIEELWKEILAPASIGIDPRKLQQINVSQLDNQMQEAIRQVVTIGPRSTVRLGIVVLLTALYALAVGPGDYFLERWLGRPKLTWVTFPIIVAVFTATAYFGARFYVGGEMESPYREQIRYYADEGIMSKYELGGLFVPMGRTYTIGFEDRDFVMPLQAKPAPGDAVVHVLQDEGIVEQRIPIWTQRQFERRSFETANAPINFTLRERNDEMHIEVVNTSDMTLRHIRLLYNGNERGIGTDSIPPGGSVELAIGSMSNWRKRAPQEWQGSFGSIVGEHLALSIQKPTLPLVTQRDAVLSRVTEQGGAVLLCSGGTVDCPMVVNGTPRENSGSVAIQVVTYEGVEL